MKRLIEIGGFNFIKIALLIIILFASGCESNSHLRHNEIYKGIEGKPRVVGFTSEMADKDITEISKRTGVNKNNVQRILREANRTGFMASAFHGGMTDEERVEVIAKNTKINKKIVNHVLNDAKAYYSGEKDSDETVGPGPGRK